MHDPVCCPLVTESPVQVTVAGHPCTSPADRASKALPVLFEYQSVGQASVRWHTRSLSLFFFFFFCVNTTVSKCHRAEDTHIHTHTHRHVHTVTQAMLVCGSAERSTHRASKGAINITERRADEWP
jgi:hypothetical protein